MKVKKTRDGKLQVKVKKRDPIVSDWRNPDTDAKASRAFGRALRDNSQSVDTLKQVSDRKYIDSRESINKN